MRLHIIVFVTIGLQLVCAQIPYNNIRLEYEILQQRQNLSHNYRTRMVDSLLAGGGDSLGTDIILGYRNDALDPYTVYRDGGHLLISPYYQAQLSSRIHIKLRLNIENNKDQLLDRKKSYWGDVFGGARGDVEIGTISYRGKYFNLKLGRDYQFIGLPFFENLVFSQYNYPYDQISFEVHNKFVTISSYYLRLNSIRGSEGVSLRHFNGHRFTFNLFNRGYIALNDIILYGGNNRQINPVLFNPFLVNYVYQQNTRNFESNSLLSAEVFYRFGRWFVYGEFLLDDFQVDKEVPGDLEPNEFGYSLTLGQADVLPGVNWSVNHTLIANRTYNAPVKDYEKFIYKNYPIGHFLGNNFWLIQSRLSYGKENHWLAELTASYREFGEEALYGPFNTDYLNYTVEEGYDEPFPFGAIQQQAGLQANLFYHLNPKVLINLRAAYWFKDDQLPEPFSYMANLAVRL